MPRRGFSTGLGLGRWPQALRQHPSIDYQSLSEIPAHSHALTASQADGVERTPNNQRLATGIGISGYQTPGPMTQLNGNALAPAGGDMPHNNLQPYLTFYFNIALQGVFPPRT